MVAISLYRDKLHRVPDVPQRWLMPTRKISLKDFKNLLQRRNKSLSRSASSSNPNPDSKPQIEFPKVDGFPSEFKVEAGTPGALKSEVQVEVTDKGGGSEAEGGSEEPVDEPELKPQKEGGCNAAEGEGSLNLLKVVEKPVEEAKTNVETVDRTDELNENEKRKGDVEEKLLVLNARKHNLVQVLKQILNVEEELKRHNSMQDMAICGAAPLQVEVPNDPSSMSRLVTPSLGSETNLAVLFHLQSLLLECLPYIQNNVVPHPARASMVVTASPSRLASAINQGHQGNLPSVSLSGTNYVASSPSPAASGGTSAFKDAYQTSPESVELELIGHPYPLI